MQARLRALPPFWCRGLVVSATCQGVPMRRFWMSSPSMSPVGDSSASPRGARALAVVPGRSEGLGRSRSGWGADGGGAGAAAEVLAGEADGDRALADR